SSFLTATLRPSVLHSFPTRRSSDLARIVRDDLPIAVLRVFKGAGFKYLGELTPLRGDTEFERDRVDLTLDDIRHHAGLVLSHHQDRKSTRLNSSHVAISYAVFCLKK